MIEKIKEKLWDFFHLFTVIRDKYRLDVRKRDLERKTARSCSGKIKHNSRTKHAKTRTLRIRQIFPAFLLTAAANHLRRPIVLNRGSLSSGTLRWFGTLRVCF